ncbi:hypothetical protein BGZ54_001819 [Gamsiella multidivaricata]|nr:hypothetical protein BGZ54_001819 [Gamsiella multidivaricata]
MVTSAISNTSTDASSSLPFLIYPVAHHRLKSKLKDTMSCSLCTYAEICMIPQARVCVRTQRDRSRPLIQVLDWSMQESVDIDDSVNSHQDLVSGMAVNQQGTLLVTCSIDEAIRVWDVHQGWCCAVNGGQMEESFKDLVAKYGCPIQSRRALLGHIGWVNAVAIENTTVVSGGSDHTVRVWDAISGTLLRLIPNLFLSREIGLGVYAVAIHGSLIGSGSVIEGYQIHDFTTGKLLMDLDEPLPAKDHVQFESVLYQQYASRMAITDAVVVTNSKLEGMLCVWSRQTGRFLYRIRVCPRSRVPAVSTGSMDGVQLRDMVTHNASEPSGRAGMVVTGVGAGDDDRGENTVHTFKVNSSGSVLMCTLCDGRVSMFEFGMMQSQDHGCSWDVESSVQSVDSVDAEILDEEHQEHRCSALAWIWTRDTQGHNRLVSV